MFQTLYYPAYNPPAKLFRSSLLFSEKLHIIVPDGVDPELEPSNDAIVQDAPDLLEIQKQYPWSFMDWSNHLAPLDAIFREIVEQRPVSDSPELLRSPSGEWYCPGHVFLHRYKSDARVRELLAKHGLLVAIPSPVPGYDIVERKASCLILSLLADNISAEKGLHTVTDQPVEHLATVLCAPKQLGAVDALAASIIEVEIPDRISALTSQQFLELRARYAEIREPFHAAISELFNFSRLQDVRDPKQLRELVRSVTAQYSTEVAKLRASSTMAHVKKWVPFSLSTVAGFSGALSGLFDTGTATAISVAGACISITLELLDARPGGYVPARAESQRLLADLQSEIFRTPVYKRIIAS